MRGDGLATLLPNAKVPRSRLRGYRVFVYSHDHPVPPHVHVGKGVRVSDWRLDDLKCVDPDGFDRSETLAQQKLLKEFFDEIIEAWREHWEGGAGQR